MPHSYFTVECFEFLQKLSQNNTRDWFNQHKQQYEDRVRLPALDFIEDMEADLKSISPHFTAIAKKSGGSLMRVYRDIRFGKDKSPYKTNIGIQFRHERGKDVHAPGFYVHIEKDNCFLGAGIWRPDSKSLSKIRDYICAKPDCWQKLMSDKKFINQYAISGDSLIRAPRGYDINHPLIHDLKRKDFIGISAVDNVKILDKNFKKETVKHFKLASQYMQFLCNALELQY